MEIEREWSDELYNLMMLQWVTRQVEEMEAQADLDPPSSSGATRKPGTVVEDVENISEEAMLAKMGMEVRKHEQGT
ncbi:MAG: hypothetical protein V3U60_16235 [Gammaproteobacteria bacterium]